MSDSNHIHHFYELERNNGILLICIECNHIDYELPEPAERETNGYQQVE